MKALRNFLLATLPAILLFSCGGNSTINNEAGIDPEDFHLEVDGKTVRLLVLKNNNGLELTVTNYGASIVSLMVPDKDGKKEDILLGFDKLEGYLLTKTYMGAVIGRCTNRISNGEFMLNGQEFELVTNSHDGHLHGGIKGFNAVVWDAEQINPQKIEFDYLANDMDEGYPGNLSVRMTYELTDQNEIKINYEAITDKPTPVNLSHMLYFNLNGAGKADISNHILTINADYYTPVDDILIPTGEIAPVTGTIFDFSTPSMLGKRLAKAGEELKNTDGYDVNYVLNQEALNEMVWAATLYEPKSGREMEVYTDLPGMQLYTANYLEDDVGKNEKVYHKYGAICLQAQQFPDAPNKPNFPNIILNPGETYQHTTIYKFGIK